MKTKKTPPKGVGSELLKRALVYYYEDLNEPTPEGIRQMVPVEDQREFVSDLINKL
jgi:hypothetical protein